MRSEAHSVPVHDSEAILNQSRDAASTPWHVSPQKPIYSCTDPTLISQSMCERGSTHQDGLAIDPILRSLYSPPSSPKRGQQLQWRLHHMLQ